MTASGTSGHGAELSAYFDLSTLGAVVVKSLSFEKWSGNPAPRIVPSTLGSGMLNSVGLQNPGVEAWLETDLPQLARTGSRIVVSIWGRRPADYERTSATIADAIRAEVPGCASLVALECNISCPNVEDRRRVFAHSRSGVGDAVGAVSAGIGSTLPVWAKMSPNVTDLADLASCAVESGAEALTLINTVMGMSIDPASGRSRLGGGGGGLSGPAVHPVAVRAVFECREALPQVPIVGVGGVASGADAAELMAAGADAVQVGTATFANPRAPARVLAELASWCEHRGFGSLDDLKGFAHGRL